MRYWSETCPARHRGGRESPARRPVVDDGSSGEQKQRCSDREKRLVSHAVSFGPYGGVGKSAFDRDDISRPRIANARPTIRGPLSLLLRANSFILASGRKSENGGFCTTPRKGSIQYEQHLWFECNRLIAKCIHLLQRRAPLSTCCRTMRAVAARRGISETGFRRRMATLQSIRAQRVP